MRIKNVYIEITNLCNLNCITCYNRSGLNQTRCELRFADLAYLMERLSSEFGCESFAFGGGEPFLYTEMNALLAYMQAHTQFQFRFVTNGTIHMPEFFSLVHSDPARFQVQISLDGSCERINALTRGAGAFSRAAAFLDRLASPRFLPLVKMVLSQKNLDDAEAFFHMAISHGGIPEYAFIHCNGNAADEWETKALTPQQKIHILKLLDRLNAQSPIKAVLPYSTRQCPLVDPDYDMAVLIKTDGCVQPCQLLYDPRFSIGNILTDSKETLTAGMNRISKLAQERAAADFQCHRCMVRQKCAKGCMAIADYACGDPLGNDGDCLTRKLEIADFELAKHLSKLEI
ncbi:MAG: radical SAM protein [Lachnospiraceae bacterium]|jgi:radical SAM protein with 4Fe4S-binding SPASM domain|nr:radical SAM protein [Lachnospiraceae bacterium]